MELEIKTNLELMINAYKLQYNLYKNLLSLAEEQLAVINSNSNNKLAEIIIRKDETIVKIKELEKDINLLQVNIAKLIDTPSFNFKQISHLVEDKIKSQYEQQLKLIKRTIMNIVELEEQSEKSIKRVKEELSGEIIKLKQFMDIHQTYLVPEKYSEPIFFDKKK